MAERATYVLAFDLATRTGWAKGAPGMVPESKAVTLAKPSDPDGTWQRNIRALYLVLANDVIPDLVIWETPASPESWKRMAQAHGRGQNGESLIMQNSLSDILKGTLDARGIPFVTVERRSVLKHYTGRGSWTSAPKAGDGRKLGKEAVLRRAIRLGHLPEGCRDDDRADAIALWDYGCAVYCGFIPKEIVPFEQGKMAHQGDPEHADGHDA